MVEFTENLNHELKIASDAINELQHDNSIQGADREALLDYIEELKQSYNKLK